MTDPDTAPDVIGDDGIKIARGSSEDWCEALRGGGEHQWTYTHHAGQPRVETRRCMFCAYVSVQPVRAQIADLAAENERVRAENARLRQQLDSSKRDVAELGATNAQLCVNRDELKRAASQWHTAADEARETIERLGTRIGRDLGAEPVAGEDLMAAVDSLTETVLQAQHLRDEYETVCNRLNDADQWALDVCNEWHIDPIADWVQANGPDDPNLDDTLGLRLGAIWGLLRDARSSLLAPQPDDLMAALQQEVRQAREENTRVRELRQQLDRARKDVELNKAGWAAEIERTKALESAPPVLAPNTRVQISAMPTRRFVIESIQYEPSWPAGTALVRLIPAGDETAPETAPVIPSEWAWGCSRCRRAVYHFMSQDEADAAYERHVAEEHPSVNPRLGPDGPGPDEAKPAPVVTVGQYVLVEALARCDEDGVAMVLSPLLVDGRPSTGWDLSPGRVRWRPDEAKPVREEGGERLDLAGALVTETGLRIEIVGVRRQLRESEAAKAAAEQRVCDLEQQLAEAHTAKTCDRWEVSSAYGDLRHAVSRIADECMAVAAGTPVAPAGDIRAIGARLRSLLGASPTPPDGDPKP